MLQELIERLVVQHRVALSLLLGEIGEAFDRTTSMLAQWFPDVRQVHGGVFCGNVRQFVLAMNGIDAQTAKGLSSRTVPPGASCGQQSTLRMTSGPNSSVRLGDSALAWARVRKLKQQDVESLSVLMPEPVPGPRPGTQLMLDEGLAERVLGPEGIGERYELFVYWWPTPNMASVEGAVLAAVADVDTSEERILAFASLPPAVRPETVSQAVTEDYEPQEDFEKHLPQKSSDTGDSGA